MSLFDSNEIPLPGRGISLFTGTAGQNTFKLERWLSHLFGRICLLSGQVKELNLTLTPWTWAKVIPWPGIQTQGYTHVLFSTVS